MSGSILQGIIRVGLLALLASQASPAAAGAPQRFVVFGDSLSDPGNAFVLVRDVEVPPFDNLIPDAPYARGALHFSDGATWVEQLSILDHALPSTGPALLNPAMFSNYAVGGARARHAGFFDLSTQVGLFVNDFSGQTPTEALYVVFVGGNDVRDALAALARDPTFATSLGILNAALTAIRDNLLTLRAAGASSFFVVNAPDVGLAPAVRLLGPAAQGAATFLAAQFNVTNVTQPCIAVNANAQPFCANPGTFLFWDGIHPTVAGHRILAERARAALAP